MMWFALTISLKSLGGGRKGVKWYDWHSLGRLRASLSLLIYWYLQVGRRRDEAHLADLTWYRLFALTIGMNNI